MWDYQLHVIIGIVIMETAVINIQYIDNLNDQKLSKFSLRGAARLSFSALT
jgi:hypothetical protein